MSLFLCELLEPTCWRHGDACRTYTFMTETILGVDQVRCLPPGFVHHSQASNVDKRARLSMLPRSITRSLRLARDFLQARLGRALTTHQQPHRTSSSPLLIDVLQRAQGYCKMCTMLAFPCPISALEPALFAVRTPGALVDSAFLGSLSLFLRRLPPVQT